MSNFPVDQMCDDWIVDASPIDVYFTNYQKLKSLNGTHKEQYRLIPNHLYKWDKGTVPPVADGVKWYPYIGSRTEFNSNKDARKIERLWRSKFYTGFMIVED